MAQLCWIPVHCSQANPSHRSCNSWSLQLPSLSTSPMQHILLAARSALGPVQDPAAPAYHPPPERSHLSAGSSPAVLHGVTLALCLETWPLSQADNSQHRIKTWCLTWSRAPSAQPHSPRQQEKAPQSKGGLSETQGTAQIWVLGTVLASWGLQRAVTRCLQPEMQILQNQQPTPHKTRSTTGHKSTFRIAAVILTKYSFQIKFI